MKHPRLTFCGPEVAFALRLSAAAAALTLLPPLPNSLCAQATSAEERIAAWETHQALEAASPFREMSWRPVGPMQA